MEIKQFLVKKPLKNFKAGQKISIKFKNGLPAESYWRRRLIDAQVDNCLEEVENPEETKKTENLEELEKPKRKGGNK